jgi:acetyltransferase-like isoleucine patch superfamily enzyme
MRYLKYLHPITIVKTLYFNLKYLPFKQAVRIPIFVSRHVWLYKLQGKIIVEQNIACGQIKIGFDCVAAFDWEKSRTIWHNTGTIIFKGRAFIGHGSKISVGGTLTIGSGFSITAESTIMCLKNVDFGDNCLLSWQIMVMDTDFHTIKNAAGSIINQPAPIKVGSQVWIGCRCTILKGASIPDNCVIAANSVVRKG